MVSIIKLGREFNLKNQYPKISIVTPSYNQGCFIEDAVLSVFNQNYPNFEHIIIDNCSTDGTIEILRKYHHLKWFSEKDYGQSDAINKGFKLATGEIIAWLNADDYYLSGAFDKIVRYWEIHPYTDIIYGDCCFVNAEGKFLRGKFEIAFDLGMLIYYGCYIPSTATFFRRSIIDEEIFLNTEYHICMDMEYFVRMGSQGKRFSHIPEYLACFRRHESNISNLHSERLRIERRQIQKKYGFYGRFGRSERFLVCMEKLYKVKHIACKFLNNHYIRERNPVPSETPTSGRNEQLKDE
jgi:glycosyltransferase involved in cell wall biosynthesis